MIFKIDQCEKNHEENIHTVICVKATKVSENNKICEANARPT
jgi:hypothetical protein